ncbi:MAG: outer membrane protein assembly factor BamA [Chlamydiales bacterium]
MWLRIITLLSVFVSFSLFGYVESENPLQIQQLEFELINPNVFIAPEALRSRIKTREGETFSQDVFDADLKALAKEFDTVEPTVEVADQKVFISIRLGLKPQIRTILFEGNEEYPSYTLMNEMGLSPGQVFDRTKFSQAFQKLKAYYITKGYFESQLNYTLDRDPVTNEIDIRITVCEGRSGKIEELRFQGFTPQEQEEIFGLMVTKRWNFWLSWFTNEGIYNEEMIQHDQYQIINYLQDQGYADANVIIKTLDAPQKNRIIIDITADKGQRYRIGDVTIQGNTTFTEEQLRSAMTIVSGMWYSPETLRASATALTDLYGSCGYIDSIIDFDLELDETEPLYHISILVDEGNQYRVGLIKILGNTATQSAVILHESLLVPGELFNINKLKLTEQRLKNVGYFKNVNVYAVKTDAPSLLDGSYRDVHIEVEEDSTGNVSAFFGLSNVETIFGGLSLTEKNFNIAGLGRLFRDGPSVLRGGGEYLHLTTSVGDKSRSYVLSWTKPYFYCTPWVVGFDVEKSNVGYISDKFDVEAYGFQLNAKYPINPYVYFGCHYRYRVSDADVGSLIDEKNAGNINRIRAAAARGRVSASGFSFNYDSTDRPLLPRSGFRSRFEAEYAGFGGSTAFIGVGYYNSWYYPVTACSTFKVRGDIKYILPSNGYTYDDVPLDERLFLGGNTAVRGFKPYAIGPNFGNTNEPSGGISLNLFTAEYSYYFAPKFEAFAFLDAGQLTDKSLSFGSLYKSAGFGVRLGILPGAPPLTLGLGFPFDLSKDKRENIKHFFFSFGGSF